MKRAMLLMLIFLLLVLTPLLYGFYAGLPLTPLANYYKKEMVGLADLFIVWVLAFVIISRYRVFRLSVTMAAVLVAAAVVIYMVSYPY